MGTVLSGPRGPRGGRPCVESIPAVSIVHRWLDDRDARDRPALLIDDEVAEIRWGPSVWVTMIEHTPQPNGGVRRHLICHCGDRRRSLYIMGHQLGCRGCLRLHHAVQHETKIQKSVRRTNRARRHLCWPEGPLLPHGFRPTGMSRKVYKRLVARLLEAEAGLLPAVAGWADRAADRFVSPTASPKR